MEPLTLTEITQLPAGSIFRLEPDGINYIKLDIDLPMICNKHVYRCLAIPQNSFKPKKFTGSETVIFISESKLRTSRPLLQNRLLCGRGG